MHPPCPASEAPHGATIAERLLAIRATAEREAALADRIREIGRAPAPRPAPVAWLGPRDGEAPAVPVSPW